MDPSWWVALGLLSSLGGAALVIAVSGGRHPEYPAGLWGWLLISLTLMVASLILAWNGLHWPWPPKWGMV